MRWMALAACGLLLIGGCGSTPAPAPAPVAPAVAAPAAAAPAAAAPVAAAPVVAAAAPASMPLQWKALAAGGDDSIPVFDNAVDRFAELMSGPDVREVLRYTSTPARATADRPIATVAALDDGLHALQPGPGEACLVFVTSHGARDGLLMKQDLDENQRLNPSRFAQMLDASCGEAPTVAIVSGCFSGIFLSRFTETSNRIILTAARRDHTSFGCSADEEFTYFDACLFDAWPLSATWETLFDRTAACVRQKESELGFPHSQPQAWFGNAMRDVAVP